MKNVKIAKTGSQYHRVKGYTFRISDHDQPSTYQVKNYFNVNNVQDIYFIIKNPLFKLKANPYKEGDFFYNAVFNNETEGF